MFTIDVPADLITPLTDEAARRGTTPQAVAEDVLRRRLLPPPLPVPIDEWERRLFGAAIDCGVSVSDEALSSEGLYE